jgi:hypothetical protein
MIIVSMPTPNTISHYVPNFVLLAKKITEEKWCILVNLTFLLFLSKTQPIARLGQEACDSLLENIAVL